MTDGAAADPQEPDEPEATPLLSPADGVPELAARAEQIAEGARRPSAGPAARAVTGSESW